MKKDATDLLIEYLDMGLTNEEIVERMTFNWDGRILPDDEAIDFIEFIRSKRKVH